MNTETRNAPATNGAGEHNPLAPTNGANPNHSQLRTESKLASRLQDAIDDRGRYSYKLKELSLGYAAGAGIKEEDAKEAVKAIFHERMGVSLQDYLTQHREENGLPVDKNKDNGYER